MSREVKRVPLDFDAPIGETWAPLLRPESARLPMCEACYGYGGTATSHWLQSIGCLIAMLADDIREQERGRELHPYLGDLHNRPYHWLGTREAPVLVQPRPSADAMELVLGLIGEHHIDPIFGTGSSAWCRITRKLVEAAGLDPETWGICTTCEGEGSVGTPEQRAAHEAWEPAEIPTGDGWQLWQTVSEGGPVSPVFAAPEELARWMVSNRGALSPGDRSINYDTALRWVTGPGWAISGAIQNGKPVSTMELSLGEVKP